MVQRSYGKYNLTEHLLIKIYTDFVNKTVYGAYLNAEYIEYYVNDKGGDIKVKSDRKTYVSVDRINFKRRIGQ